jgi:hypothetical protein
MPFRDDLRPGLHVPADPLARFQEIHAAFDEGRGWLQDRDPLRLAAINLLTVPGDPAALAATTRACNEALKAKLGWFNGVDSSVRMVIASYFIKYDEDVAALLLEIQRARDLFAAMKVRGGGIYSVLAALVLRRVLGGAPVDEHHVARLKQIYAAMKHHHWWLTGPEDLPACAMLVGRPGEPADIGVGIEAIYRQLRERARLWPGEALQTAANVLYLHAADPAEIAARFAELVEGFRAAGTRIGQDEYDEIAVLCFLSWPVERVIATVLEFRDRMRTSLAWLGKAGAFSLAASLAFVRLASADQTLGPLADAKLLLDMQAIVTAREASG